MKGVVLAGGLGTRLYPLTQVTNKHLLPVYDKPMILYALDILKRSGVTEIMVVCGREHAGHFMNFLGSGKEFGVKLSYALQDKNNGGISDALLYAEDFAPEPIINCPNPAVEYQHVAAAAAGDVIVSGNENDPTDKYHSMIEIKHASGLITGYIHVANINVKVGQHVEQGAILGNPSCEFPPGGEAKGVHLHFFVLDQNKRAIPITGFTLSGWQIQEGTAGNTGIMTKAGIQDRTANLGRCGPSEASIRRCGGIRMISNYRKHLLLRTKATWPSFSTATATG